MRANDTVWRSRAETEHEKFSREQKVTARLRYVIFKTQTYSKNGSLFNTRKITFLTVLLVSSMFFGNIFTGACKSVTLFMGLCI